MSPKPPKSSKQSTDGSIPAVDDTSVVDTDPQGDFSGIDPFLLFASSMDKVELYRIEPKQYQGVSISGYLTDVDSGMDQATVKRLYGGGRFMVVERDTTRGTFKRKAEFEISGAPKIEAEAPTVSTQGVLSDDPTFREIQKTLMIDRLLGGQKNDNDSFQQKLLLELISKDRSGGTDFGKIAEGLAGVVTIVKDFLPKGETGPTGIMDILGKLVDAVPTIAGAVMAGKQGGGAGSAPGTIAGFGPGLSPQTRQIADTRAVPESQEGPGPSLTEPITMQGENMNIDAYRVIAENFATQLIGWWISETEANDAIACLDFQYTLDAEAVAGLKTYRNVLWTLTKSMYVSGYEQVDVDKARIDSLQAYFGAVFDGLMTAKEVAHD